MPYTITYKMNRAMVLAHTWEFLLNYPLPRRQDLFAKLQEYLFKVGAAPELNSFDKTYLAIVFGEQPEIDQDLSFAAAMLTELDTVWMHRYREKVVPNRNTITAKDVANMRYEFVKDYVKKLILKECPGFVFED